MPFSLTIDGFRLVGSGKLWTATHERLTGDGETPAAAVAALVAAARSQLEALEVLAGRAGEVAASFPGLATAAATGAPWSIPSSGDHSPPSLPEAGTMVAAGAAPAAASYTVTPATAAIMAAAASSAQATYLLCLLHGLRPPLRGYRTVAALKRRQLVTAAWSGRTTATEELTPAGRRVAELLNKEPPSARFAAMRAEQLRTV